MGITQKKKNENDVLLSDLNDLKNFAKIIKTNMIDFIWILIDERRLKLKGCYFNNNSK